MAETALKRLTSSVYGQRTGDKYRKFRWPRRAAAPSARGKDVRSEALFGISCYQPPPTTVIITMTILSPCLLLSAVYTVHSATHYVTYTISGWHWQSIYTALVNYLASSLFWITRKRATCGNIPVIFRPFLSDLASDFRSKLQRTRKWKIQMML